MKSRSPSKYLPLLFWLGPFLLAVGFSAGFVGGDWGGIPIAAIVAGGAVCWAWLVYRLNRSVGGFWARRSTEDTVNALFATLAVVAILAAVNFLAVKYAVRVDFTENRQFTLAPESRAIAAGLDDPVQILVFSPRPTPEDRILLENYRRASDGTLQFEYVDPQLEVARVREFGVSNIGDVYLQTEAGERQFVQNIATGPLSESQLSRRLLQVSTGEAQAIYFVTGHGEKSLSANVESSLSQAVRALENRNFDPQPLNLSETRQIPEDAAAVVVAGPTREWFEGEVEILADYLAAGGSGLLAIDPATDPGFGDLLAEWEITLDDRLAIDPERWVEGLGLAAPVVADYGAHPITEDFGQNFSIYPTARPILFEETEAVQTDPLLFTSDESWAESDFEESSDWVFDAESDRRGPLVLGVAARRYVELADIEETESGSPEETDAAEEPEEAGEAEGAPEPEGGGANRPDASESNGDRPADNGETEGEAPTEPRNPEARLAVFGDADFLTDGLFEGSLNGDVFLNTINWLSQSEERPLTVRSQPAENRRLQMSPRQARFLVWTALLTFPVAGFAASGLLWWRRR